MLTSFQTILRAYYSTLSVEDISKLELLYKNDFLLFDYQPSYIFKLLGKNSKNLIIG